MVEKSAHDFVVNIGFYTDDNNEQIEILKSHFDIVCEEKDDYNDLNKLLFENFQKEEDSKFSKRMQELEQELQGQKDKKYQLDIIDVNAEMKLLESILKEDGYLNKGESKNGKFKK